MPNIYEQEIASVKERVDCLDSTLTNAIKAINSIDTLTVEAFRKLKELEQAIQLLKEELYNSNQDKVLTAFEEYQEDYHIEEDFLDNDEEQDDEG